MSDSVGISCGNLSLGPVGFYLTLHTLQNMIIFEVRREGAFKSDALYNKYDQAKAQA